MMRSAIYYPHTELRHKNLLKNCLLLWDQVDLIVPFENYKFHYEDKLMSEAIELIGRKREPLDSEKRKAHNIIEDFATGPLPESFFYSERENIYYQYGMWPQKLLPETWDMLLSLQLVGKLLPNSDYPLQDAAGLALMSILADCCAGTTKARITDRGAAYAALTNLMVNKSGTTKNQYEAVVPLSLKLIRTSDVSLRKLIDFREREANESGHTLRNLRHNYLDKVTEHVKKLGELENEGDLHEQNRCFEQNLSDDLKSMRSEMRASKVDVLLSKEILVTAAAAAGSFFAATHGVPLSLPGIASLTGGAVSVGGFVALRNRYVSTRLATMRKHPMAYLYELGRSR